MTPQHRVLIGDCGTRLKELPDKSIHCVVTSPPYWGLRDYGHPDQIGLETTPTEYVAHMVAVFREIHRVLRDDGTVWLNLGDSYTAGGMGGHQKSDTFHGHEGKRDLGKQKKPPPGMKPKNLVGIPWRVAFALQDDGWYLRQDIIWCLSGGAWVYARTQKGEMPVMVKDLVRLNPSAVQLWNGTKWTRVLGWNQSADTTEKFEIVLRSGERIGCTGGHLWPTQRGNVAARDLRVGDVIATCTIPEPEKSQSPGYMTPDAAWLTGLYLAEGSRSDDMAQLSLHADETKWLPRIESVAHHFGGTMSYTVLGNKLSVRLYGRVLMAHFENYIGGHTAHDKHLTNACWKLPNKHLKEIAHGYLNGDGHYDPKNSRVRLGFTRNYSLERDLRTLAARLGATISLRPSVATCTTGKFPSFRGEWRWSRSGHWNERDMGEVTKIHVGRARKFWDIGVEDEPHLFALASGVLTHNSKGNPMPEPVTDRCTRSHEYLFMLTKQPRYYYDCDAIREPQVFGEKDRNKKRFPEDWKKRKETHGSVNGGYQAWEKAGANKNDGWTCGSPKDGLRNKRSVWHINPKPFRGAHFATMPPGLVEPCVLAGTSEAGCCPTCLSPWRRVIETSGGRDWRKDCQCDPLPPIPCTVLDPFGGSGTVGMVAQWNGRNSVLCELNQDYANLIYQRINTPREKKPTTPKQLEPQDQNQSVLDLI